MSWASLACTLGIHLPSITKPLDPNNSLEITCELRTLTIYPLFFPKSPVVPPALHIQYWHYTEICSTRWVKKYTPSIFPQVFLSESARGDISVFWAHHLSVLCFVPFRTSEYNTFLHIIWSIWKSHMYNSPIPCNYC